jgi:DNA-binding response OmpR family regulator
LRYFFEDYVFDTERRELWRGATALAVEPQVFDLLAYLIENRERVVSKTICARPCGRGHRLRRPQSWPRLTE